MNVQCPEVGLYWPIYLLEVNSSVQYSSPVRQVPSVETLSDDAGLEPSSSCWPGCISGISPLCLHGDHGGHASGASPKRRVLWNPASQVRIWSFGKPWRIALHLHSQLAVCSQCTGSCWHFGKWSSSACWRHPKRLTGWLCAGRFSQWATRSFGSASIAVGVGRSSSQKFMQLRCYILETWLQLQKVDWDQTESKLI